MAARIKMQCKASKDKIQKAGKPEMRAAGGERIGPTSPARANLLTPATVSYSIDFRFTVHDCGGRELERRRNDRFAPMEPWK